MRAGGFALVVLIGCGGGNGGGGGGGGGGSDAMVDSPGMGSGMATVTAKMLNGASPGARQMFNFAPAAAPTDGNWQISPTRIHAPLVGIELQGMMGTYLDIDLTGCALDFDLTMPGLAQSVSCTFMLPAGTYRAAGPRYADTFDVLIDDSVNNLYTDPAAASKIVTTAPAGGAQAITLANPRAASLGPQSQQNTTFAQPFVVNAGDTVSVSMLFNALQALQVSVIGGQAALGVDGNGKIGYADTVTSIGTPAAVAFYVDPDLATPYSYDASTLGNTSNPLAIGVLYSAASQPAFLSLAINGQLTGCGPLMARFLFPGKGNGYLGLDSSGTLGWAGYSDQGNTMVSAVMNMVQKSTLGQTTTFNCLDTTTDPMPPGDSFSSGAPVIASPTFSTTMTLVAN